VSAVYVEAPDDYTGPLPVVFLAGGITGCPDWQREAVDELADVSAAVCNPRRADFPIDDPAAAPAQIEWEYRHLARAAVVLFWFPAGESPQPIALYELGFHAATGKVLAVGADPGYLRRHDVVEQLRLARPDLMVHDRLAAVCAEAAHLVRP
jgi:hypothetical protein